jgi:hypothetical protein
MIVRFEKYRNALIRELSDTFKYVDYMRFKERVIESIENEQVNVIAYGHLKAVSHLFAHEERLFEEEKTQFKSFEFRERLIADYLNVLNGQKENLEIVKLKLSAHFPDFQQRKDFKKDSNRESCRTKFRELNSEEAVDTLVHSIQSQNSFDQQMEQFKVVIESLNNFIEIITEKCSIALQLSDFLESILKKL